MKNTLHDPYRRYIMISANEDMAYQLIHALGVENKEAPAPPINSYEAKQEEADYQEWQEQKNASSPELFGAQED